MGFVKIVILVANCLLFSTLPDHQDESQNSSGQIFTKKTRGSEEPESLTCYFFFFFKSFPNDNFAFQFI